MSEEQEFKKQGVISSKTQKWLADKKRKEEEKVDMSNAGQAGTDDFMKSGPGIAPEKDPTVTTTPTKREADDISGEFKTTKQRQHYRDKYSALTPAFMMDEPDKQAVIARERLRNKAGELFRTNPAEWNKLYGGDKLGKAIEKAEQDAYAKFDEPQTTQKPAPIVDKSTTYKPDRNANLANNQIGDAYGVLSEPEVPKVEPVKPVTKGSTQTVGKPVPKVEPVKPVTKGSKQTVGKSVPVKETRDFENWVNSVGKV